MKCEYPIQHSPFIKFFSSLAKAILSGLFILGFCIPRVQAQMFSVGSQGPRFNTPQTELYLGLEPLDVNYEGGSLGPSQQGGAFEFNGSILRVGYNSPGVSLFLGTGGEVTGIDNVSYFDIGGNIDLGINLHRSKEMVIQIPVRIASRYTTMSNDQVIATRFNRFKFGSLTGGAGLRFIARPAKDIRLEALGIPSYGASFATGGFFGGSVGSVNVEARMYFDRLFGDVGLSFGYKYDFRNYNVDENVYDYKMMGHNLELGITF